MQEYANLFGIEEEEVDTKYSVNVNVPQYLPKNECPNILDCFSSTKYNQLLKEINDSSVTDDEKKFLKLAATRHLIFSYSKVADYYAHATKEMQELMEHSALVIIDFDDALANGYVKLTDRIFDIAKQSKAYSKKVEKYGE